MGIHASEISVQDRVLNRMILSVKFQTERIKVHQSQLLKNQPIKAEHFALYEGFATFLQKGKILERNLNVIAHSTGKFLDVFRCTVNTCV